MKDKILIVVLVFSLMFFISITIVSAQTCDVAHIKNVLRKALFDYFKDPSQAKLDVAKIKDLLTFYLGIAEGEVTVDCSKQGMYSGVSYEIIIEEADKLIVVIPECSDGTKYGECSLARPRYCYAGNLVERCNICGCPSMRICQKLQGNCIKTSENIACNVNSDCGTDNYTGNYLCKDGDVYRNYTKYTCLSPGKTNSSCITETAAVLIDDCNVTEKCVDGQNECQTNISSEVRVNADHLNEYYFLLAEYYQKFLNPEFGRGCVDNYCQNVTYTDVLVLEGNVTARSRYYEDIIDDIRSRGTNGTYYINIICYPTLEIEGVLEIVDSISIEGCLVTIDYEAINQTVLPDLIITGMTWPSYIEPSKNFLSTMTVKNIGNAPFSKPDVSITFAIATPLTTPRCVHGGFSNSLLPGESVNQTFVISCVELEQYNKPNINYMSLPEGTFEITVIIDYDNAVNELNEANNNFTKTIVVGKPTSPTCIDSDTGKDYFVKGTIKSWNGTVESYDCCATSPTDSNCVVSSNYLAERYCTPSGFMTEIYTCPSGCTDGACIRTVNKPDLIIADMRWPSYIEPNKTIYPVNITIKNIGNASKPYSSITFAIVNPLTTPRCVHGGFWASILPGETVYETTVVTCSELQQYNNGFPRGTYEMNTIIDYDNTLNEWNETNNNFTKTIVVGNP